MSSCNEALEDRILSRMASIFGLAGRVVMQLPLHNLDDFLHYAIMKSKQQCL